MGGCASRNRVSSLSNGLKIDTDGTATGRVPSAPATSSTVIRISPAASAASPASASSEDQLTTRAFRREFREINYLRKGGAAANIAFIMSALKQIRQSRTYIYFIDSRTEILELSYDDSSSEYDIVYRGKHRFIYVPGVQDAYVDGFAKIGIVAEFLGDDADVQFPQTAAPSYACAIHTEDGHDF